MSSQFPLPIRLGGRVVFRRYDVEKFNRASIAAATGEKLPEITPPSIEEFVGADQLARELGISRRTIDRRIVELSRSEAA